MSTIRIQWPDGTIASSTPGEMAIASGDVFPVASRVPGAPGEAFGLPSWYRAAAPRGLAEPTHAVARAADGFEADIPWSQLGAALLQYAVDGEPLVKGKPMRLYVPDGTSACLNVKSVVELRFEHDAGRGDEATYGFVTVAGTIGTLKRRPE